MKERYQIVGRQGRRNEEALTKFTQANGQFLLPLVELIAEARVAVDDVIHELGRKTIEMILDLSAQEVAGARAPGKARGEVRWHGSQPGRVTLGNAAGRPVFNVSPAQRPARKFPRFSKLTQSDARTPICL